MTGGRSHDTYRDNGYDNYISEKKSFRLVNKPESDIHDEDDSEEDDKPKPYTAVGAAVTSAERFRRRMNYGRVKKTKSSERVSRREDKQDFPEKNASEESYESRRKSLKSEKSTTESSDRYKSESLDRRRRDLSEKSSGERNRFDSLVRSKDQLGSRRNSHHESRRRSTSRDTYQNNLETGNSRNKSPDERNDPHSESAEADLRKKYPHWYEDVEDKTRGKNTPRSQSRGSSPIQVESPKQKASLDKDTSPKRYCDSPVEKPTVGYSSNRRHSDSSNRKSPDGERGNSGAGRNDIYGRPITNSSDKYSRYRQEENKKKKRRPSSTQRAQLTPSERYTRRKSYDASSSRATSPLPDLRNIRSSGYANVDREYQRKRKARNSSQSWSGGSLRSFVLLPAVEN